VTDKINQYKAGVENILEQFPDARESDATLYFAYLKHILKVPLEVISARDVGLKINAKEFPQFATIIRTRQIIQAKHSELQSTKRRERLGKAERIRQEIVQ